MRRFNRVTDGFLYGAGFFLFNFVLGLVMSIFMSCGRQHQATAETLPKYMIAVIDSGYDPARATVVAKLCKQGHWDYLTNTPNPNFTDPHGTRVTNLIAEKLKGLDYCILVYQVFGRDTDFQSGDLADALHKARIAGANVINISLGGLLLQSTQLKAELEENSKMKIATFVAAGNHGIDLDKNCAVYPACYHVRDLIVVGAQDAQEPKKHSSSSNYGKKSVDMWAPGWYSDSRDDDFGTSYAAPRALSEYVLFLEHKGAQGKK